jgi:hypothetical protein
LDIALKVVGRGGGKQDKTPDGDLKREGSAKAPD